MNHYNWGWFDGEEDCDPPEPNKKWIAITNAHDNSEVCVLVLRNPKKFEHLVPELEERAEQIISALEKQHHYDALMEALLSVVTAYELGNEEQLRVAITEGNEAVGAALV